MCGAGDVTLVVLKLVAGRHIHFRRTIIERLGAVIIVGHTDGVIPGDTHVRTRQVVSNLEDEHAIPI